jgi:hypothetical protein
MKKVSTGAAREKRNVQEQKLTIGLEPRRIERRSPIARAEAHRMAANQDPR